MKLFVTTILCCISLIGLQGQDEDPVTENTSKETSNDEYTGVFGFGVKAGVNLANVKFDPEIYPNQIITSNYGVFFNYLGEPHAGIQLELNYAQKGWAESADSIGEYSRIINYLEIPLLAHFEFGKRVQFVFDLGPYIAYHLNSKESNHTVADSASQNPVWGKSLDADFDYGYHAGVGLGWKTQAGSFIVNVRYAQGLANIFTKYPNGAYRYTNTTMIHLGITYQFSVKRK